MSSMFWVERTAGRRGRGRRARLGLVAGLAVSAVVLTACGGTTGEEDSGSEPADDGTISVFGAFATPLEEPWDGAIHAALTAVA